MWVHTRPDKSPYLSNQANSELNPNLLTNWVCLKKPPAAFPAFAGAASRLRAEALRRPSSSPFFRAHVLSVHSARKNGCGHPFERPQGRSGRTFLNRPGTLMSNLFLGKFALENLFYSTLPNLKYPPLHMRPLCQKLTHR
jgi:hypothetical protein